MVNMRDAAVVIGRFQVPRLTSGHHGVLSAASKHALLLVLVGCGSKIDERNPLDAHTRMGMIAQAYPHATIAVLNDVAGDDKMWSNHVDNAIHSIFGPCHVTFYGGRDSFYPAYEPYGLHKNFHMVHQIAEEAWSGSTDRAHVVAGYNQNTEDFRRGVIYGVNRVLQAKSS